MKPELGISLVSIMLSIYTWYSTWRKVTLSVDLENQVQLMQEEDLLAFNVLILVTTTGASTRWSDIKVKQGKVTFPDGTNEIFSCRTYLKEAGLGQQNASRNIPLMIKGGDSKSITAGFQSNSLNPAHTAWTEGNYVIEIECLEKKRKKHFVKLSFSLGSMSIEIVKETRSILTVESI